MNDEAKQTDQGQVNEEDIIDLTEVAEEDFLSSEEQGAFDDEEGEPISLDTTALDEEEEIVELVDVAEKEEAEIEEPLDLSGLVEEESEENQTESGMLGTVSSETEEQAWQEDASEGVGLEMEETPSDMSDSGSGVMQDTLDYPLELEEDVVTTSFHEETQVGEAEAGASDEAVDAESDMSSPESSHMDSGVSTDAVREVVAERLSDEKLEAMVMEAVNEKVDRILLEVAETAITKEIEKIKKAL